MQRRGRQSPLRSFSIPFGVPTGVQPEIQPGAYVIAFDYKMGDQKIHQGVLVEYRDGNTAVLEGFDDELFMCQVHGMETQSDDELSEKELAFARQVRRRNHLPE